MKMEICYVKAENDYSDNETATESFSTDTNIQYIKNEPDDEEDGSFTNETDNVTLDTIKYEHSLEEMKYEIYNHSGDFDIKAENSNAETASSPTLEKQTSQEVDHFTEVECKLIKKTPQINSQISNGTNHARKSFKCNVCDKEFNRSNNRDKHLRRHIGEKPYECDFCDKKFLEYYALSTHMRIHTGEMPFKCNICNKKFNLNCNLKRHLQTHTEEKPHDCHLCSKKFKTTYDLMRHIRTHTGVIKLFECNICKKQVRNLTQHLKLHTGKKAHGCEICFKKFAEKSNLTKHVQTHSDEKPFQCPVCQKNFSLSSYLSKHIRKHTGKNVKEKSYVEEVKCLHTRAQPHK